MPEYRKQIDTPPVILHRKDIEGVARFFEPTVEERSSASFSFSSGDATFRAQSIEQLLQHDLPPVVDSLYFSVTNYDRHHGITLSLSKRHGNYNINAIDETWFKGKIQQINDFLSARRPWYLPISSFWISGLVSGCIFALFTAFAFFISQHSILGGSLAGLLIILLIWIYVMLFKGRLLPHTKIILQDSTNKLNKETLLIIVTVLLVILTALEVVLKLTELLAK